MYMAVIRGNNYIYCFGDTPDRAKELAVEKLNESNGYNSLQLKFYTWEEIADYYGAYCIKIADGATIAEIDIFTEKIKNY